MATRRKARRGNSRRSSNKRSSGSSSASIARTSSSGVSRRSGRKGGGGKKRSGSGGPSPKAVREKANWEGLVYGAVAALGFGFAQSKVALPGIKGVPNSLTYGVGAVAAGVLLDSDTVMRLGSGPLMAGLHNLAIKGFTDAEQVSGEFDALEGEFDQESVAGEFDNPSTDAVEGEFEEVAAGDFADL